MESEKLLDCVRLGQRMRAAQREFFKTKDRFWLIQSKQLEKEYDALAELCLQLHRENLTAVTANYPTEDIRMARAWGDTKGWPLQKVLTEALWAYLLPLRP